MRVADNTLILNFENLHSDDMVQNFWEADKSEQGESQELDIF
jgi:hypothetical protein